MGQSLFGNTKQANRRHTLSPEVNEQVDRLLWDASHPTKESIHFGYDMRTASAIIVEEFVSQIVENARNNQSGSHEPTKIQRTIAEVVLSEAGYTNEQTQQEISRIRLNIFSDVIEHPQPYLQLVS